MKRNLYIISVLLGILLIGVIVFLLFFTEKSNQNTDSFTQLPYREGTKPYGTKQKIVPTGVGFSSDEVRPFDTLFTHELSSDFKNVLESIYLDTYAIIPCNSGEGNTVVLTAKYTRDDEGNNTTTKSFDYISKWEPYLLNDIGIFIFPDLQVNEKGQKLVFEDMPEQSYKRAPVFISGEERFMYSGWLLNYVLYSSSEECLQETARLIYDSD